MGLTNGTNSSKRNEVRLPPKRGIIKIKIFNYLVNKFGFNAQQGKRRHGGSRSSVICPSSCESDQC